MPTKMQRDTKSDAADGKWNVGDCDTYDEDYDDENNDCKEIGSRIEECFERENLSFIDGKIVSWKSTMRP